MKKASLRDSLRFQIPIFTFIRMLTSIAFRMVYPFLPVFRDALGVSLATLSSAIGLRSLSAALLGPFFASLADSRGRKTGMMVGLGLFVAGASVVVFWPTFHGFVVAMILTLLGKVTFDPSMQAYIGDRVAYKQRGLVLTLTELGWSGAFILGVPAVGFVISRFGWLAPFPLLGGLVLLMGIWIFLLLPEDPRRTRKTPPAWTNFGVILRSRNARFAMGFVILSCVANELVSLLFSVWMEDSFGLKLMALGATAALLGIAELGGEGLVAAFTDRIGKQRAITAGIAVNSVAAILLPIIGTTLLGAEAGLFLFYISFEFMIVSSVPLMTEVMPRARATMMAGFFTSASIGRAVATWIGPVLYTFGFQVSTLAAVVFNLAAFFMLSRLQLAEETD